MKWLVRIAAVLGALAVATLAVAFFARFHDGPLGPFPGGPMNGQVVKDAAVDWSFARGLDTIALQTSNPPRSRTVWFVLHDEALYVPCGMAETKSWPEKVAEDPVVLLRVGSDLYVRTAMRVDDAAERAATFALVAAKYGVPDGSGDPGQWIYRMDPFDPLGGPRPR